MNCRNCGNSISHTFADLGFAPPSNAYLRKADLSKPEICYPLKVLLCDKCWMVQTKDYTTPDSLFTSEYAYFSSTSSGWVAHAEKYFQKIVRELNLGRDSHVLEVGSNDGYLLRNFHQAGIPCLGIEPTDSTADAAEKLGIQVLREFFSETLGQRLSNERKLSDLIVGNNVYAHTPDIKGFTKGLKLALKPGGTLTLEFPHLMNLMRFTQFDTIYHEHFSYLSLYTACQIFATAGLRIWHVENLPTHGGSIRVYGCHKDDARENNNSVLSMLNEETDNGLQNLQTYLGFQDRADQIKDALLSFLIKQKAKGKKVVGYGAAAKGNTLLNYAGVKPDLLPFVCDAAPSKQGKFMPGSHIPIVSQKELAKANPDYVLILPWNISKEVRHENAKFLKDGVKFVTTMKHLSVL